ncbi:hypothetical protein Skr01_56510 [Sphaerisporangium krabiense]|uniref:Ferric oxidoreductase domain-containing protein n=1 Tax=Sphaerisporangium krabiense TaxID=763782 RepID=A0A7W8ZB33_9ACTN|nr:hypothetical protein [Sphaerisporangium krabiense]MBB5630753.1 hypothetical protein [Sphaerisporangium krabiense]GII65566.1 hypothetical protein Skr01_56510 [Sphaerisporangium krabiense]
MAGLFTSTSLIAGTALFGASVFGDVQGFLIFYSGVFTLVALTATVLAGLAATDRILLAVRHRVRLQAVHRAAAVLSAGFLITHVVLQILRGRLDPAAAFLPGRAGQAVGLGTIAAYLLVLAAATGAFRGRFATMSRPWVWRTLHVTAYLCWPLAIVHGLTAGREPADWVTLCYVASLVAVGLGLLVRMVVTVGPRRGAPAARPATIGRKAEYIRVDDVFDEEFWVTLRKEVRR